MEDASLAELGRRLSSVGGVVAVMLGGSRARGAHRPDSDIAMGGRLRRDGARYGAAGADPTFSAGCLFRAIGVVCHALAAPVGEKMHDAATVHRRIGGDINR